MGVKGEPYLFNRTGLAVLLFQFAPPLGLAYTNPVGGLIEGARICRLSNYAALSFDHLHCWENLVHGRGNNSECGAATIGQP